MSPFPPPHYALTREEVILQLNALGPAGTNYVKTEDAANGNGIK